MVSSIPASAAARTSRAAASAPHGVPSHEGETVIYPGTCRGLDPILAAERKASGAPLRAAPRHRKGIAAGRSARVLRCRTRWVESARNPGRTGTFRGRGARPSRHARQLSSLRYPRRSPSGGHSGHSRRGFTRCNPYPPPVAGGFGPCNPAIPAPSLAGKPVGGPAFETRRCHGAPGDAGPGDERKRGAGNGRVPGCIKLGLFRTRHRAKAAVPCASKKKTDARIRSNPHRHRPARPGHHDRPVLAGDNAIVVGMAAAACPNTCAARSS